MRNFVEDAGRKTGARSNVHDDLSTESTYKLPSIVEFCQEVYFITLSAAPSYTADTSTSLLYFVTIGAVQLDSMNQMPLQHSNSLPKLGVLTFF